MQQKGFIYDKNLLTLLVLIKLRTRSSDFQFLNNRSCFPTRQDLERCETSRRSFPSIPFLSFIIHTSFWFSVHNQLYWLWKRFKLISLKLFPNIVIRQRKFFLVIQLQTRFWTSNFSSKKKFFIQWRLKSANEENILRKRIVFQISELLRWLVGSSYEGDFTSF